MSWTRRSRGPRRRGSIHTLVRSRPNTSHVLVDVDCFGCRRRFDVVDDVVASISSSTMTWDRPLDSECTYAAEFYFPSGIVNCQDYGLCPSAVATPSAEGTTTAKYHSAGVDGVSGEVTLQRNGVLCQWRKRHAKLVQAAWHHALAVPLDVDGEINETPSGGNPIVSYANYEPMHDDVNIVYPYSDPVDADDQWTAFTFPAADAICGTAHQAYYDSPSDPTKNWQCENASCSTILTLEIVNLVEDPSCSTRKRLPTGGATGTPHWLLTLTATDLMAWYGWAISNGSVFGPPHAIGGKVTPYLPTAGVNDQASNPYIDTNDPDTDLDSCPVYWKKSVSLNSTLLRWAKPVDCYEDFRGAPMSLQLINRTNSDSCAASMTTAADFYGLTGYSTVATIQLLP